jgi:hypothetical protein
MDVTRDRIEILELLNRHPVYIDLRDAEGYAGIYSEDGQSESPFASARGTEALMAMTMQLHESGCTGSEL